MIAGTELQPKASAQTSVVYDHEEYCETESFNATCDAGEVILVELGCIVDVVAV